MFPTRIRRRSVQTFMETTGYVAVEVSTRTHRFTGYAVIAHRPIVGHAHLAVNCGHIPERPPVEIPGPRESNATALGPISRPV